MIVRVDFSGTPATLENGLWRSEDTMLESILNVYTSHITYGTMTPIQIAEEAIRKIKPGTILK